MVAQRRPAVVVVTGASAGVGRAVARRFAERARVPSSSPRRGPASRFGLIPVDAGASR
jgi:NAD(P)-dependent dehydrogenase (short-subunit alcohol dehydrogenase family)